MRGDAEQIAVAEHPRANTLKFRPPREAALWSIDLANASSYEAARTCVLEQTAADAAILIETKKRDTHIPAARAASNQANWRMAFSPALATSTTGTSGGTAVGVRKGLARQHHSERRRALGVRLPQGWR